MFRTLTSKTNGLRNATSSFLRKFPSSPPSSSSLSSSLLHPLNMMPKRGLILDDDFSHDERTLRKIFARYDTNGDGHISKDEFLSALATSGITEKQAESAWEKALTFDKDKVAKFTESIEYQEFARYWESAQLGEELTGVLDKPIYKIVLTGGPCGGKSSALSVLQERLSSFGFDVFSTAEAATILITGGVNFLSLTADQNVVAQTELIKTQMQLEDGLENIARSMGKPSVIICDRGCMDNAAYIEPDRWQNLLDLNGWSNDDLGSNRYDMVLHLVTAAIGAPEFYTTSNNAARSETAEEAISADHLTRQAWLGHPKFQMIHNEKTFQEKLEHVVHSISRLVGIPQPTGTRRTFLVEPVDSEFLDDNVKHLTFELDYIYLLSPHGVVRRIAVTNREGQESYSLMTSRVSGDRRVESHRILKSREFNELLSHEDKEQPRTSKTRKVFLHNHHYFELDSDVDDHAPFQILSVEVDTPTESLDLPEWVKLREELEG